MSDLPDLPAPSSAAQGAGRPWLRTVAFGLFLVAFLVLADRLNLREQLDPTALRAAGAAPTPGLIGLLALLWLAMLGGSAPAITAGALILGWAGATVFSVVAALCAHSLWFWLARTSLRGVVLARAGQRVRWLIGVIDRGGIGLVIAWNVLGAPGVPFLFAAALSRLPYRIFALGVVSMLPRVLITALMVDTLAQWDLSAIPKERWLLLTAVGVPIIIAYSALLALRPELRPWRFGRDDPPAPDPDVG